MDLDRYQLVRTIASGGMGQVYEAVARGHDGFSRRVAIKRLLPELIGDEHARQLFRDEARIASHLHHGNIVQVLDFGVVESAEFLVLEYVDGIDAYRLIRRLGPAPEPLACYVTSEIAHALSYAHARTGERGESLGIVHRDVSGQNILLSWEGDVKLSDFGIALAVERSAHTKTGMVKGKLGYISPEQLRGERATAAADIYALGVTLEFLLYGKGADDVIDHEAIARTTMPVRTLIAGCTADDPGSRPSADAVAREAARLAGGFARTQLRDYLVKAAHAAPPRSALDDLMGLVLIPSDGGTYTIDGKQSATTPLRRPTAEVVTRLASADDELATDDVPTRAAGTGRSLFRRWLAPLAATALAGAGAAYLALPRGASPTADASTVSVAIVDPDRPAIEDAPLDPAVEPARVPVEPARAGPADAASARLVDARPRSVPSADASAPRGSSAPDAPQALRDRVIRIGAARDPRLMNADVLIDGVLAGTAPDNFLVSVGSHHVIVRDRAGTTLLDRRVAVDITHTRTSPFVLP